ncbi:MAG: NADH-quinone oxidoreductase subunit NuoH [Planctomycetota bacterium]|nr:MAG: NADH-quinone oxidoreductase subunit NuoH [Planctomycetota bacterium]
MSSMVLDAGKILLIFAVFMQIPPLLIYLERKICAFIQDRIGPNRVGPFGILQPLADAIKLITKESITPKNVDVFLYTVAPLFVMVPAAISFAVVPVGADVKLWGHTLQLQIADFHVGILFFLAITSLSVYGLTFGAWASNNKYSLYGGIRSTAQMISYEVAMGLAVICVLMSSGTVYLREMVFAQSHTYFGFLPAWNVFHQPLAFVIFLIAAFAETNRLPFDLPEAESELVGGYHTEYSGMKFAMFFMGEYMAMISMSAIMVTLFFGGWTLPGVVDAHSTTVWNALLSVVVFGIKTGAFLIFFIWIRWTLPRLRYDQLMKLGWKVLIPLALMNLFFTAIWGLRDQIF